MEPLQTQDEKARIEKSGGRVVFDGYANYRVYAKNARYPGTVLPCSASGFSGVWMFSPCHDATEFSRLEHVPMLGRSAGAPGVWNVWDLSHFILGKQASALDNL